MLFDPFIRGNELAKNVDLSSINPQYILISHAHSDHTADAVEIAKQSNATILGVYEVCSYLLSKGATHIHPLNIGGKKLFNEIEIKMIPAIHSSSFEDGTYGGIAGGFTVESPEFYCYYAGDTSFFSDMQRVVYKRALDLAILPIGGNFTMDTEEALECAKLLKVKKVMGVHFNTFGYININTEEAIETFKKEGIELIILPIGTSITI